MNREEILHKSRMEQTDEREEQIRSESIKWTFIAMVLIAGIFAFMRAMRGETITDLTVTVCGAVTVSHLYRYWHTKNKEHLYVGLVTLTASIIALIMFCMGR